MERITKQGLWELKKKGGKLHADIEWAGWAGKIGCMEIGREAEVLEVQI